MKETEDMKLKEAVKKSLALEEIKTRTKEGFFFNSALAVLDPGTEKADSWIVTFYDKEKNVVAETLVTQECAAFKQEATPLQPTKTPLDLKRVKTDADKMIQKASKEFAKLKLPLSQILVSIQNDGTPGQERPAWHVNFITKTLAVAVFTIDAETGALAGPEVKNLIK